MATRKEIIEKIIAYTNKLKTAIKVLATQNDSRLNQLDNPNNPILKLMAAMTLARNAIDHKPIVLNQKLEFVVLHDKDVVHSVENPTLHDLYLQCQEYLEKPKDHYLQRAWDGEMYVDGIVNSDQVMLESVLLDDIELVKIIVEKAMKKAEDYLRIYEITKGEARKFLQQIQFYNRLLICDENAELNDLNLTREEFYTALKLKPCPLQFPTLVLGKSILRFINDVNDFEVLSSCFQTFFALNTLLSNQEIALELFNRLFSDQLLFIREEYIKAGSKKYLLLNKLIEHEVVAEKAEVALDEYDFPIQRFHDRFNILIKNLAQHPKVALSIVKKHCTDVASCLVIVESFNINLLDDGTNIINILLQHTEVVMHIAAFFTKASDLLKLKEIKVIGMHPVFVIANMIITSDLRFFVDLDEKQEQLFFDYFPEFIVYKITPPAADQKFDPSSMSALTAFVTANQVDNKNTSSAGVAAVAHQKDNKDTKSAHPALNNLLQAINDCLPKLADKIKKATQEDLMSKKHDNLVIIFRDINKILHCINNGYELNQEDLELPVNAEIHHPKTFFTDELGKIYSLYQIYFTAKIKVKIDRSVFGNVIQHLITALVEIRAKETNGSVLLKSFDVDFMLSCAYLFSDQQLISFIKTLGVTSLFNCLSYIFRGTHKFIEDIESKRNEETSEFLLSYDKFLSLIEKLLLKTVDDFMLLAAAESKVAIYFAKKHGFAKRLMAENSNMKLNAKQFKELVCSYCNHDIDNEMLTKFFLITEHNIAAAAKLINTENFYDYFYQAAEIVLVIVNQPARAKDLFLRCFPNPQKYADFIRLYMLIHKPGYSSNYVAAKKQVLLEMSNSTEVQVLLARHINRELFEQALELTIAPTNLVYRLAHSAESALVLVQKFYQDVDLFIQDVEKLQARIEKLTDEERFVENIASVLMQHAAVAKYFAERITPKQLLKLKQIDIYGLHPACLIEPVIPLCRVHVQPHVQSKDMKATSIRPFNISEDKERYGAEFPDSIKLLATCMDEVNALKLWPLAMVQMVGEYLFLPPPAKSKPVDSAMLAVVVAEDHKDEKQKAVNKGDEKYPVGSVFKPK